MNRRHAPPPAAPPPSPEGVDEQAWIEVIRKMDEVYNDLLQYEVALEQKNASLEAAQAFIFSVLGAMSDLLVVGDRHGRIEEVNEALVRLTGRDKAGLAGQSLPTLFADTVSQARVASIVHDRRPVQDVELQLTGADGQPMAVAVNATPRLSGVGKYLGLVLTGRPVGELRRAYDALRQAHEELKQTQQQLVQAEKMASLGRLVAGVAHELNNPISFVIGNVHAMQRYAGRLQRYLAALHAGAAAAELDELRHSLRIDRLLEDLPPLLDGMREGAERTRDIVDGLKRFSAPDRGDDVVFDLAEVARRSLHWVVKAAGARLAIELDLGEPLWVRGSAGQMQQVLVNLVQNAVDATESRADARLQVCGRGVRGGAELRLVDNGPGFAPQALDKVFDPFFTTKPVGKGTGLGLSISYGIVQRHGGSLSAANAPEGGGALTLRLPLAAPPPPADPNRQLADQ